MKKRPANKRRKPLKNVTIVPRASAITDPSGLNSSAGFHVVADDGKTRTYSLSELHRALNPQSTDVTGYQVTQIIPQPTLSHAKTLLLAGRRELLVALAELSDQDRKMATGNGVTANIHGLESLIAAIDQVG